MKTATKESGKTLLQWAKAGYVIKADAQGTELWTNSNHNRSAVYFTEDEVMANAEEAKAIIREKNRKYRQATEERKEFYAWVNALRENTHTKYQWLFEEGRIPKPDAKWIDGCEYNRQGGKDCNLWANGYLYCTIEDTYEPVSQTELEAAQAKADEDYQNRLKNQTCKRVR